MTEIHWQATARADEYDYLIRPSDCHPGTFVLRVANGQTNETLFKRNSFTSVEQALRAADEWRTARQRAAEATEEAR